MVTVFLSYAHADRDWFERISRHLEDAGHRTWLPERRLAAGSHWQDALTNALESADLLLAVLSPAYFDTPSCTWESTLALARGRPVLPVRVRDCQPPASWPPGGYTDLFDLAGAEARERLLKAVRGYSQNSFTVHVEDELEHVRALLERSSLGTAGARRLSGRVPRAHAVAVVESSQCDFFITYMPEDAVWAGWIAEALDEAGFKALLDPWDFTTKGSAAARSRRRDRGKAGAHTIALISPSSAGNGALQAEWEIAAGRGNLLPVRLHERCEVPSYISRADLVELNGPGERAAQVLRAAAGKMTGLSSGRDVARPCAFPGKEDPRPGTARAVDDHVEPVEPATAQCPAPPTEVSRGRDHPPGRVAAFSAFYREFACPLVTFLVWQGARLPDATDIAQETMTKAYQSWERIEQPAAWARTVASRDYTRRVASIVEDPVGEAPDLNPLLRPDADVATFEQRHEVLGLLALLPPRQRQVLAWTNVCYTPAEIAEELAMRPEAVRSCLHKARRALAGHLEGRQIHDGEGRRLAERRIDMAGDSAPLLKNAEAESLPGALVPEWHAAIIEDLPRGTLDVDAGLAAVVPAGASTGQAASTRRTSTPRTSENDTRSTETSATMHSIVSAGILVFGDAARVLRAGGGRSVGAEAEGSSMCRGFESPDTYPRRDAGLEDARRLSDEEITELARVYHSPGRATRLLRRAGFQMERLPVFEESSNPRVYWSEVNELIEYGLAVRGRQRLLAAARTDYPANRVFLDEDLLRDAKVGQPPSSMTVAGPGTVVEIRFPGERNTEKFLIGSREDHSATIEVFSPFSPLGGAVLGHAAGETVSYTLPNGRAATVEIVSIVPHSP